MVGQNGSGQGILGFIRQLLPRTYFLKVIFALNRGFLPLIFGAGLKSGSAYALVDLVSLAPLYIYIGSLSSLWSKYPKLKLISSLDLHSYTYANFCAPSKLSYVYNIEWFSLILHLVTDWNFMQWKFKWLWLESSINKDRFVKQSSPLTSKLYFIK